MAPLILTQRANTPGKAEEDGLGAWAPDNHMCDPDGITVLAIYGEKQQMEGLLYSLFLLPCHSAFHIKNK